MNNFCGIDYGYVCCYFIFFGCVGYILFSKIMVEFKFFVVGSLESEFFDSGDE